MEWKFASPPPSQVYPAFCAFKNKIVSLPQRNEGKHEKKLQKNRRRGVWGEDRKFPPPSQLPKLIGAPARFPTIGSGEGRELFMHRRETDACFYFLLYLAPPLVSRVFLPRILFLFSGGQLYCFQRQTCFISISNSLLYFLRESSAPPDFLKFFCSLQEKKHQYIELCTFRN